MRPPPPRRSPATSSTPGEPSATACSEAKVLRPVIFFFTQPGILRDEIPEERRLGIEAGLAWGPVAEYAVVYTDLGITPGMELGLQRHQDNGIRVEYRQIPSTACDTCANAGLSCLGQPPQKWHHCEQHMAAA